MKLQFDESVQAFRAEFLVWLEANRPSAQAMIQPGLAAIVLIGPKPGPDGCLTLAGWFQDGRRIWHKSMRAHRARSIECGHRLVDLVVLLRSSVRQ